MFVNKKKVEDDCMVVVVETKIYNIPYRIRHVFDHNLIDNIPQENLREVLETELSGKILDEVVRVYEFVRERRGFDPRPRKKNKGPRDITDVCV